MITLNNESFFLFFQNMTEINGFKGFVGYGIRELDSNETSLYCSNAALIPQTFPLIHTQVNFTSDFMIRTYTSGCYFFDTETGKWSSNGIENFYDTNMQQTHCTSTHLTSFAGGLIVLPNNFNFDYIFANASIPQNLIIYCTVIFFLFLYFLFAFWSIVMDRIILGKLKITPLKDNNPNDNYFYELMVFTGNRPESGTHSKVSLVIF